MRALMESHRLQLQNSRPSQKDVLISGQEKMPITTAAERAAYSKRLLLICWFLFVWKYNERVILIRLS